jgi:DNA-binding protein H-NS
MLLNEIEKKIEELKAQAEQVKHEEKRQAVEACKAMILSYGVTAKDLGLDKVKGKTGPTPGRKIAAKYRNPSTGAVWSGRGKTPKWINGATDRSVYAI